MTTTEPPRGYFARGEDHAAYGDDPVELVRNQHGHPMIHPEGGGEANPYVRVSTIASAAEGGFGLSQWKIERALIGCSKLPHLLGRVSALPADDHKKLLNPQEKQLWKSEMKEIIETAHAAGDGTKAADEGTIVHGHTQYGDQAQGAVPAFARPSVDAWNAWLEQTGAKVIANELFVVNDRRRVAGSLDCLIYIPALDRVVVADKKTGKINLHKFAVQMAGYAQETAIYDPETYTRQPLSEFVEGVVGRDIYSPDLALVVSLPNDGSGMCEPYFLKLDDAAYQISIALAQREWRKSGGFVKANATPFMAQQRLAPLEKALQAEAAKGTTNNFNEIAKKFSLAWCPEANALMHKYADEIRAGLSKEKSE